MILYQKIVTVMMNNALGAVMEEISLFAIVNMESVNPASKGTWVELNWVE